MNMILYHGTNEVESILEEGLKGGHNENGTHGTWKTPLLFLTPDLWTAAKYGRILKVDVNEDAGDWVVDNAGNKCFVIECEKKDEWGDPDFDEILISPEHISEYICCEEDACVNDCQCPCDGCATNYQYR